MQGPSVAVIGVGVNHRLGELAGSIDQPVTDVASHAGALPSRNLILARALVHLVAILDAFERSGFAPLRDEWRSLHAYQGARVRVTPSREPSYEADVVDVAEDGALLVAVGGRTIKLASAEIADERVRTLHGRG
jgi:BirA family biotin operon repressor/biotin-[acetyl-CoA-carboxylase] ligase